MNNTYYRWIAGLFLLAATTSLPAQTVDQKLASGVQRVFGTGARTEAVSLQLTTNDITRIAALSGLKPAADFRYMVVSSGGKRVGYAIVDNVRGKAQLITYALMIDPTMAVRDLEVLAYREPYGGEVANETFRRQFRGKRSSDNVRVGAGIRNISGATISSNAVTNGTRRLLATMQVLKEGGRLR